MKDSFVVPIREKIAYGLGDLGNCLAYGAVGFYFVFFLTDVAGLPAEWAGYIFLIARAWDAVTDYVMGLISDRVDTRYGRRRPFILFGAIPFGVTFMLLWIVPFESTGLLFVYYVSIAILFNTAFTVVGVPYNAMLPELSQNYDERTSLSAFKVGLSFIGTLLAAAGVMVVVDLIYPGKGAYESSFPVMGGFFGAIIAATLLITFFGTRERVRPAAENNSQGFFATLRSILSLPEFRLILGMFLFNMIGFDVIQAMLIYFLKYVVEISDDYTFLIMGIPIVVAILFAPLWVWLGERFGKREVYIAAAIYLCFVFSLALFAPAGYVSVVIAFCVFAGVGLSATQVIPFSIIPDIVEVDEYENGTRREGAFYGITMFLYKAASAVAVNLSAFIIGYFGYVESKAGAPGEIIAQPDSAIMSIRLVMALGPAIFFMLSAYFVYKLPITRERFNEIKEKIRMRDQNGNP